METRAASPIQQPRDLGLPAWLTPERLEELLRGIPESAREQFGFDLAAATIRSQLANDLRPVRDVVIGYAAGAVMAQHRRKQDLAWEDISTRPRRSLDEYGEHLRTLLTDRSAPAG